MRCPPPFARPPSHARSQALEDWGQTLRSEPALDLTQSTPPLPHILLLHIGLEWVNVLLFQPFSQVSARGAAQDLAIANIAMTVSLEVRIERIRSSHPQRCHQSALKIDELGQLYHATHGMRFTPPTMAQMQYTSGTSFVLAAAQARNAAQAADDLERARRALFYLKEIGLTWGAGRQKESILSEIIAELEEKAAPGFDGSGNPLDETVPQVCWIARRTNGADMATGHITGSVIAGRSDVSLARLQSARFPS